MSRFRKSLSLFPSGVAQQRRRKPIAPAQAKPNPVSGRDSYPNNPDDIFSATRQPQLWAAVFLPQLPLAVFAHDSRADAPLAVADGDGSRCVIVAVNGKAAAHGVHAGTGLNSAYALAPSLEVVARQPRREQELLARLATWCQRFTALVSPEPPAGLLLEVRGSLRLFGGLKPMLAQLREGLQTFGVQPALSFAPTPLGALWLARAGGGGARDIATLRAQLAELALRDVAWPEKTVAELETMGVHSVRDCMRLPRDGFARRIGPGRLADLDRALGKRADVRSAHVAPARFVANLELPAESESLKLILEALRRLLAELGEFLLTRQAGVQTIEAGFFHIDAPATRVRLGLSNCSRDPAHMHALFEERLQQETLAAPVIAVRLRSGRVEPLQTRGLDLFVKTTRQQLSGAQLVERLRARFGVAAVHGIGFVPEHRPESAWQPVEPGTPGVADASRPRPLWLLREPQALRCMAGVPEWEGALNVSGDPERIETGWWDGDDVARDYFVAETRRGTRLWIFRQRRAPHAWYLHGVFG